MSLPIILGLLWVGVVLYWGWQARPRYARKPTVAPNQSGEPTTAHIHSRVTKIGFALAAVVAVAIHLTLGVAIAIGIWVIPRQRRNRERLQAQAAIANEMPEAIDLLRLAISSGLNIHQSVQLVSKRLVGPVGHGLATVAQKIAKGQRLSEALEPLPEMVGEPLRPLVRVLIDSDRYGANLETALAQLAADSRQLRRRRSEELARKLPLKLLGPLVFCILPAFVLLTLAPVLADTISILRSEL